MKDLTWWQSDDARNARLAKYVAHILYMNPENKREEFRIDNKPEWAAVFHYDTQSDTPYWVEVKRRTHAKDFIVGGDPEHFNIAARQLAYDETPA